MCTTLLNEVFRSSNDCSPNEYTVQVTNGLMIVVFVMQFNVHVTLTLSLLWGFFIVNILQRERGLCLVCFRFV